MCVAAIAENRPGGYKATAMKGNHFIAAAAAVMFTVIVVLFSRQSGLEDEIASLRAALEAAQIARTIPAPPSTVDASRTDGPESASDTKQLAAAQERLADLERVLNGQADILEDLVAEKNRLAEQKRKSSIRAWGPEQAAGEPDTMTAGDQRSAWAPAVADGGVEWLEAEFENAADLARIVVRQTCNPGCIVKVTAITDTGAEVPVWAGADPSAGQSLADTPFAVPGGINAKRVKVYLDTAKVAGWEEIDALQIVGRDGRAQWAKSVNASSTYAGGRTILGFDTFTTPVEGTTLLRTFDQSSIRNR